MSGKIIDMHILILCFQIAERQGGDKELERKWLWFISS
jgi:hypothetical protein